MSKLLLNEEKLTIRWMDMDVYQHVAHQKYFDYLTEARHTVLIKPYMDNQEEVFFLVDIGCDFKQALTYPQTITVKLYLAAKGNTSFTMEFEFFDEQEKLCTTAFCTLVCINATSHQKVIIPDYLQQKFGAFSQHLPTKYTPPTFSMVDNVEPLLIKTVPIRYADMDAFKHVNNSRYFDYMLEARHALFEDNNPLNASCYFFIIHARCLFYQPLHYPGDVTLNLYLTHLGRSSFSFGYTIYDAKTMILAAEGLTTLVCVDKKTLKPIKVPEELLPIIRH